MKRLKMDDNLREIMIEMGSDKIDELAQSIVKIERSFKDRRSSMSTRREQIQGEIKNYINSQKESD